MELFKIPSGNLWGYILIADLDYPQELHDQHNDYPFAPEQLKVCSSNLSTYLEKMLKNSYNNMLEKYKSQKHTPNLNSYTNYVVYYHNLQLCVELGIFVARNHSVSICASSLA